MKTRIAAGWKKTPDRRLTALLMAVAVVVADILLSLIVRSQILHRVLAPDLAMFIAMHHSQVRAICSLILLLVYLVPEHARVASFGLRLLPEQGLWWWSRVTLLMGVAIGVLAIVGFSVMHCVGYNVHVLLMPPAGNRLIHSFFWAPLTEECTYRLTLCTLVTAAFGPRAAILLSGIAFGALHFVYGCPAPTNVIAGFFLAWAFLRSGSFLVPVLLHSLGNMFAAGFQAVAGQLLG